MEVRSIGTRVFPNRQSDAIRRSPSLLHYCVYEPPIDYTIKILPKKSSNHQRVSEKTFERTSGGTGQKSSTDHVRPNSTIVKKLDAMRETRKVLEELDNALEVENHSTDSKIQRNDDNQSLEGSSFEKAKKMASQNVPMFSEDLIQDLRSVSKGVTILSINEHRREMVENMYHKTRRLIGEACDIYSPEFFLAKTEEIPLTLPPWKRELIARRKSKETLSEYESNAWKEFNDWKRIYAPYVKLPPEFVHQIPPKLF